MGRMFLNIPDELEERFRSEVYKRFGMRKGNLSRALEEALRMWIEHGQASRGQQGEGEKHGR
ncbi:MAG: hypothetical protein QXT14_02985 [Candidatus Bathyarchaeia archaeon]